MAYGWHSIKEEIHKHRAINNALYDTMPETVTSDRMNRSKTPAYHRNIKKALAFPGSITKSLLPPPPPCRSHLNTPPRTSDASIAPSHPLIAPKGPLSRA